MLIGIASTFYARHNGAVSSVDERFAEAARRRGADVVHVDPLACVYEISSSNVGISLNGSPLSLDGLLIRRAAHHWNAVKTLVLLVHEQGGACIDRRETFMGTLSGKFQALLRRYRLPGNQTPRSFLYFTRASASAQPPPRDAYPLLRKPIRGSLGVGIQPVENEQALAALLDSYDFHEPLMLQERVEGQEFRALMLGERCLGVVRKEPSPDGLGNYARGARFFRANDATRDIQALGASLMRAAPYDFAAVDVIRRDNGALYVLECNRNPQFKGFEEAFLAPGPGQREVDVTGEVIDLLLARVASR